MDTCSHTRMDYSVKMGRADAGMNPFALLPPSNCFWWYTTPTAHRDGGSSFNLVSITAGEKVNVWCVGLYIKFFWLNEIVDISSALKLWHSLRCVNHFNPLLLSDPLLKPLDSEGQKRMSSHLPAPYDHFYSVSLACHCMACISSILWCALLLSTVVPVIHLCCLLIQPFSSSIYWTASFYIPVCRVCFFKVWFRTM